MIFLAVLRSQLRLLEAEGPSAAAYRRVSLLGRGLGAGFGLVVVFILYHGVQARGLIDRQGSSCAASGRGPTPTTAPSATGGVQREIAQHIATALEGVRSIRKLGRQEGIRAIL